MFKYVSFLQFDNSWDLLLAKGASTLTFALIAKVIYNKINSNLIEIPLEESKPKTKKDRKLK